MRRFPILFLFLLAKGLIAQQGLPADLQQIIETPRFMRVMFYNCENYFDVENDSLKNDDEFTPDGERRWTLNRYYEKQSHINKVIIGIGGWSPPEIIGLCEVENRKVLTDLIYNTNLYRLEYKLIHKESPDPRGIDVALLYQPKSFTPLVTSFIQLHFTGEVKPRTRDILYTKGITNKHDTLHVFVNHWPSRWGGMMETEENRMFAASVVKQKTDSILALNPSGLIIVMGDLNDYPDNKSITQSLGASHDFSEISNNQLYDLAYNLQFVRGLGSHKYEGRWGALDHIIVSGAFLSGNGKLKCTPNGMLVFNAPFLLQPDETFLGQKPFRTYSGYKYLGGFGDHLPVFLDITRNEIE